MVKDLWWPLYVLIQTWNGRGKRGTFSWLQWTESYIVDLWDWISECDFDCEVWLSTRQHFSILQLSSFSYPVPSDTCWVTGAEPASAVVSSVAFLLIAVAKSGYSSYRSFPCSSNQSCHSAFPLPSLIKKAFPPAELLLTGCFCGFFLFFAPFCVNSRDYYPRKIPGGQPSLNNK